MTISESFDRADVKPSKRTAEGSVAFSLQINVVFALFDQTLNCSTAAAL